MWIFYVRNFCKLRFDRESRDVRWLSLLPPPAGEGRDGVSLQVARQRWHRPHPSLPPWTGEGAGLRVRNEIALNLQHQTRG